MARPEVKIVAGAGRENREQARFGAVCSRCDSDLTAEVDGCVYCSNLGCPYSGLPHPTRAYLNTGNRRRVT